ncbi:S1C family serine protease [Taibaiella soli]|uniref:Serine protease n=1 Tax=Taibaiella soli TaxID=1649169 RepID=A0A2W2B364_9BACT|nr:serine protease [Taibaiella soli]PZF74498.1 hypothetical protein DN068_02670 [Taibaiella soli]
MKKILLAALLLLTTLNLFAQEKQETKEKKNYSIIHFTTARQKDKFSRIIFINDQMVGTIGPHEDLKCKIYSEGRLTITVVFDGVPPSRTIKPLDVKAGEKYYFSFPGFKPLEQEKGKELLEDVTNTVTFEEDKAKPVGKLPEGMTADSDGPKQGTCFAISKQGYLLTNYHVVKGAKKVQVKGIGNDFSTSYGVDVVSFDADLDLAVLKLKNQNVALGEIPYQISTSVAEQGSKSFALGFPLTTSMGEEVKLTEGIISAKSGYKGTNSQYQFSAAVQPGNSGSPLFDENGNVIGIVDAKLQGAEGAGYAVKSPYINTFLSMVEGLQLAKPATSMTALSLSDKVAKLKNYTFIVTTE